MVFLAERVKRVTMEGHQDHQAHRVQRAITVGLQGHPENGLKEIEGQKAEKASLARQVGLAKRVSLAILMPSVMDYQDCQALRVKRAVRVRAGWVQKESQVQQAPLEKMLCGQVNTSPQFATAKVLKSFISNVNLFQDVFTIEGTATTPTIYRAPPTPTF